MREITTHKVDGAEDGNTVMVWEDLYEIMVTDGPDLKQVTKLHFQSGPISEVGINGITNEALLVIVKDRLEIFERGGFPCDQNKDAIRAIEEALASLHHRTRQRVRRGVEGTLAV